MTEKKLIQLDLTGCKSSYDIHLRIQEAFEFPDWYGKKWDAFWDLFYPTREGTVVEIYGTGTLPGCTAKHMCTFLELLEKNKQNMLELKRQKPEFDCRFDYRVVD